MTGLLALVIAAAWLLGIPLFLIVVCAACDRLDQRRDRRMVAGILDGCDRLLAGNPDPDGRLLATIQHGYQPESERVCERIWEAS